MNKKGVAEGFSLIELMIVIALIGIVATFAVPSWQKYRDNTNLKTAARELMGDIFDAKQRAVTENTKAYDLVLNVSENSYALTRDGVTQWTKPLSTFGNGIVFKGSPTFTVINFKPRGTVTNGSVELQNGLTPASSAKITVNITGRTYVTFDIK